MGLATAALGPTLPNLAEQTGVRLGTIGVLFTGTSFGYVLGSLGVGNLLDRVQGNRLTAILLLIMAMMLGLIPLTTSLLLLTGIFFILGSTNGGLDVCANPMLVWIHHGRANPFLNALHFFFGLGAFLTPLLVAQCLSAGWGIRGAYWLLALYPLPIALWLFRLPSPLPPQAVEQRDHLPPPWRLVSLITLVFIFTVGVELGFGGWIYTFAIKQSLADPTRAAYLTSLFWGALTVGRMLGIGIATRIRPTVMLLTNLLGCLASLGVVWFLPDSIAAVSAGTIALGLFMASNFPTLIAFAARHMFMSGATSRWFFVGSGLGGMALPWLLGVLIERSGPAAMIPALILSTALALLAFIGAKIITLNKESAN